MQFSAFIGMLCFVTRRIMYLCYNLPGVHKICITRPFKIACVFLNATITIVFSSITSQISTAWCILPRLRRRTYEIGQDFQFNCYSCFFFSVYQLHWEPMSHWKMTQPYGLFLFLLFKTRHSIYITILFMSA